MDSTTLSTPRQAAPLAKLAEQIKKLERDQEKIRNRVKRRKDANERDEKLWTDTLYKIRRLRVLEVVGKPDAVKIRARYPKGSRLAHLNDAKGTVIEVKRTRALVKFDLDSDLWRWQIDDLALIEETQGYQM